MIYDDAYMYIDMRFRILLRILFGRAKSAMCVDKSTKFGTHMTHTHANVSAHTARFRFSLVPVVVRAPGRQQYERNKYYACFERACASREINFGSESVRNARHKCTLLFTRNYQRISWKKIKNKRTKKKRRKKVVVSQRRYRENDFSLNLLSNIVVGAKALFVRPVCMGPTHNERGRVKTSYTYYVVRRYALTPVS